jgi:hypothetical protein
MERQHLENETASWKTGLEQGRREGMEKASWEFRRMGRVEWRKLFFLCLAAAFVGCLVALCLWHLVDSLVNPVPAAPVTIAQNENFADGHPVENLSLTGTSTTIVVSGGELIPEPQPMAHIGTHCEDTVGYPTCGETLQEQLDDTKYIR